MSRAHTRIGTHIRTTDTHQPGAATEGGASEIPQLLRLLHLASPALPIGAFHFSQGLEYACEAGWVHDEASALEWIDGVRHASLGTLDLPVLLRLLAAWRQDDAAAVLRWNSFLIACRETCESRLEDRHLGAALLRVLAQLELVTELFPSATSPNGCGVAHATAFAFGCARWDVEP